MSKMAKERELEYFDLHTVHKSFDRSLIEEDDVDIKAYLDAYHELFKFFQRMGSVFSFVSSDLKQKIDVLLELIEKDQNNYQTIKTMIQYEKDNNLLEKKDFVSGARTFLRLHRGLDFISEFLKQMGELPDSEKTSTCCQNAYNKTLAKHHPWVVKKAAVVAMYTMPTRENLFKKVCGDQVQRNIEVLPETLEVTSLVFDRTHRLFELHELHMLP